MLFASWVAHIPQVKARLGIGLGLLGVALLGAPIGSIVAMSAAGYLVPRLGSRRVLRSGILGYCLAGALLGVAGSLVVFFVVFMVWGVFQGTLEVAMNTQGVAVESAQGRSVMPVFHGSWSLGALVGAGIGTVAVALGVSLTGQLLVLGVISLAALAVLTSRLLPEDQSTSDHRSVAEPGARGWWTAALLILCAIALADMFCEGAAADWSAVYLHSSLAASGITVGLAYTLYSLVMVGTRFAGRRVLARWPRHRVLPSLTALATVGFALGLAAHDTAVTLVGFCCLGAGCALVIPTTYSTVGEMASASPGRAVALVSGVGWVGFVAGPPVIGQIASATSLRFALTIVPMLTALITGLLIVTRVFTGSEAPNRTA
jgi:MFS family permease